MNIKFLNTKVAQICLLISLVSTALALSDIHSGPVKIQFDKPIYDLGESAKVNVLIVNRPTNSDLTYILEGTQVLNGITSELQFKKFSNIYKALTNSLVEDSWIHLRIKLENIRKIDEISQKVKSLEQRVRELREEYNRNPESEILRQIQALEEKIKLLKIERSRNSTVVKELDYKLKINAETPDDPDQDDDSDIETPISNLVITLEGINESSFNPILLPLKLKTSSDVGFNPAGAPIFTLNGKSIDVDNVQVSKNVITFSLKADEGRNVLSVEGLDGENNVFHYETSFYSGSRNVSVNIQGPTSTGKLVVYSGVDPDFKISTNFSGPSVVLQNVPNIPTVLDVQTDANEFDFQVLEAGSTAASISVQPNEEPSQVTNDDFSLDSNGWNINSSESQIINRELNGDQIPNNKDLMLTDSGNLGIEVKRTFLAGHANKFVTLKFNLQSTVDDEVHAVIRNISTGEFSHKVFRGENFQEGPSKVFDVDQSISVKAEAANDIISIYVKSLPRSTKKTKQGLLWKRISRNVSNLILTLNGVFYESFNIFGFYAHNIRGNVPKETDSVYLTKLKTISVGNVPFPDFGYKVPFNFRFNKMDNALIEKVELIVEQPWVGQDAGVWMKGSWEPLPGEAESLSENNNRRNLPNNPGDDGSNIFNYFKDYIRYAIDKISFNPSDVARFDHEKPVRLYLAIYLDNGEVHHADLGRSLTPLEYRSNETNSIIKFYKASREPEIGGDSWGRKFVWDLLLDIFKAENNFGFSINDLSRMQGGHFDPHESHNDGLDVDYAIQNYFHYNSDKTERWLDTKAISDTIKLLSETKTSEEERVLSFVNKVFISFLTERETAEVKNVDGKPKIVWKTNAITELTDLKREQRAGCSVDNRTIKSIIRHEYGHVSHGHISFKQVPTSSFPSERFFDFRPFHRRDENDYRTFDFEATSLRSHNDEFFIWDIRNAADDSMVEVIDVITPTNSSSTRGKLLSKNSSVSTFRYQFPGDGRYRVNLVVARRFSDDLNNLEERCISQSFEILIKSDNIVNCEGEWQTHRGRETVDPVSGHKHLGGALVSKDTDFRAGRFFVEDDTSAICKESVIVDGYTDSEGCTEENKYTCASILFRGLVGVINSKIDATQGRVQIAGTDQPFIGYPMIPPTNPDNGVGNDYNVTLITDSIILPKGDEPIVIINSDIDGDGGIANIKDNAFIQQANVWWSTVADSAQIKGGTVSGTKNPEFAFDPVVTVGGNSVVKGFVGSESRLDIQDSVLEAPSIVSGGGLINRSLLEGGFFGAQVNPSEFNSVRIAKLDNSAIINGSSMGVRAHVLNKAVIGAEEDDPNWVSGISENATVKDEAWVFGWSSLMGDALITGKKVKAKNIWARDKVIVDSSIGGTKSAMVLNGNIDLSNGTKVYGTPEINFGLYANSYISEDVVLNNVNSNNARFTGQIEGTDSWVYGEDVSVSDQATFVLAHIIERAKLSGSGRVSNSTIGGTANVSGTAQVLNRCTLTSGSYTSGIYSGETPPCEPWSPARKLASDQKTFTANYSAFRKNCGSEKLFKSIKSDKKRRTLRSFSRLCNDKISRLEKRKFESKKMNLEDMLALERATRASISKRFNMGK